MTGTSANRVQLMGEFLKKKVGQSRYEDILAYLSEQPDSPISVLRKPLNDEFKALLLGDYIGKGQ